MKQKIFVSSLMIVIIASFAFFQLTFKENDEYSFNSSHPTNLNTAQLTDVGPIGIYDNNDWTGLIGNSWFQGSGTSQDPYIISNISIRSDSNCITISDSTAYFIIQGSKFSTSECCSSGIGYAGIYLSYVQRGTIYNCEFSNDYFNADCLQIRNCYRISIINNKINDATFGIDMWDSNQLNITGNLITDCYIGVALHRSDNNYIRNNNIRLTGNFPLDYYGTNEYSNIGIRLFYSDSNTIVDNTLNCIPNCIVYEGTNYGNTVENNSCISCYFYYPKDFLDLEMLISGIILIGLIITIPILLHKLPSRKRLIGIVLLGISLGVFVLLGHAVYNLIISNLNWETFYYILGFLALFGVNLVALGGSLNLIRKYGKKRDQEESIQSESKNH